MHLSDTGKSQAEELITRLGKFNVSTLRISPLERCAETIGPWWSTVGQTHNPQVSIVKDQGLIEVDYGRWSGKKLSILSKDKLWKTVHNTPSAMYFPEGEGLAAMQERAMRVVHSLSLVKRKGSCVLVTHGDLIKSIVASVLGMHLDSFQRIVIDPASISIIDFNSVNPRIILLNDSRAKLESFLNTPNRKKNLLGGGGGK